MTPDELHSLWKAVLGELEVTVSNANFKTWFANSILLKVDRTSVTVGVTSSFTIEWIEKHFQEDLIKILNKHLNNSVKKINYTVLPQSRIKKTKAIVDPNQTSLLDEQKTNQNKDVKSSGYTTTSSDSNLNQRYTFDNFVVGSTNRLAYAAAQAVSKGGSEYNPFYIYGGVGLGKTHLIQAIGNAILQNDHKKKIIYVSCENFMNEFVASISSGKKDEFKKRYRNADLIIMDDIQFIAGKAGTQEEFFHTFNALYQKNKQIILTSDKIPQDIPGLEARLSSRFSAGMVADIQPPDQEMRTAILQVKCQEKGFNLDEEIINYIAENIESNIRELEGALTTVQTHMMVNGTTPSINDVHDILKGLIKKNSRKKLLSQDHVNEIICEFYNVERVDVIGPRRNKEYVRPRQILMYLLKSELGLSYPIIGRYLGGRDHTTIMHGFEKIEKEMKKNIELFSEIKELKEQLYKF